MLPEPKNNAFSHEDDPDFNLLRIFEALYEERSASRAAIRLNLTQSAVSQRLKTLRELFNDPLFRNTGRGLAPTARAVALMPRVMESLNNCRSCFALFKDLGQNTATCQITIGLSDDFEMAAGSLIIRTFAEKLPTVRVVFKQTNTKLAKDMLLSRAIDLAVTAGGFDSLSLSRQVISLLDEAVIVTKDSWPEDKTTLTVDDMTSRPHLLIQAGGFTGTTDVLLHQIGQRRVIQSATSHFGAIPYLLKGTNLMVNAPLHVARVICEIDPTLRWFKLPLPLSRATLQVGWKSSSVTDSVFVQSKNLLIEVLQSVNWRAETKKEGNDF